MLKKYLKRDDVPVFTGKLVLLTDYSANDTQKAPFSRVFVT